ncbi:hypothetical protein CEXT_763161 [Caerostris extrusa]|uniref:Uncharacterized protein n=1 Tax=Caerostris extrusa TaxID=172846 RepID=A0AAV4MS57_CAEEX|nr:hypothetical protein CEXT_763161 [Caerostris extrusa]
MAHKIAPLFYRSQLHCHGYRVMNEPHMGCNVASSGGDSEGGELDGPPPFWLIPCEHSPGRNSTLTTTTTDQLT